MSMKELIPIVALVLSVASLALALWTFYFNRLLKGTELKAQLLVKIADSKNSALNLQEYVAEQAQNAHIAGEDELQKLKGYSQKLKKIVEHMEEIYRKVGSMPPADGVAMFGACFHDVHDLNTQIDDFRKAIEKTVKRHVERVEHKNSSHLVQA